MNKSLLPGSEPGKIIKKKPLRMCKGCGLMKPKNTLLRVVRTPDGRIFWDSKGKVPGRGAYICPQKECFLKAKKSRRLERELKANIPEEVFEALLQSIPSAAGGESSD